MPYLNPEIFDDNAQRFADTDTSNPGPLVVTGLSVAGTLQQVICEPEIDTHGRRTRLEELAVDANGSAIATPQVVSKTAVYHLAFSRRGNEVERQMAMASVVTRKLGRLCHFATTSSQAEAVVRALRDQPTLEAAAYAVAEEEDRFATHGLTAAIIQGTTDRKRVNGGGKRANIETLAHRTRGSVRRTDIHTTRGLIPGFTMQPGEGLGMPAYIGRNRMPYTGKPYVFPLGATASDTAGMYQDFMGARRRVNVAVRELTGVFEPNQSTHYNVALINGRDIRP